MPEVVSGTLPFTFSTFVLLGDVAESLVVVVVVLLSLQARKKEHMLTKMKSLFMQMVLNSSIHAIILPMQPHQIRLRYRQELVLELEHLPYC